MLGKRVLLRSGVQSWHPRLRRGAECILMRDCPRDHMLNWSQHTGLNIFIMGVRDPQGCHTYANLDLQGAQCENLIHWYLAH